MNRYEITLAAKLDGAVIGTTRDTVEAENIEAAIEQTKAEWRKVEPGLTFDELLSVEVKHSKWAEAPEGFVRDEGTGELYRGDDLPEGPARNRLSRDGKLSRHSSE